MATKWSKMSPDERRRKIARLVGNPNTRASIPTQYLPAHLRAKRTENARLDAPFVPGGDSTVRQVTQDRNAATELKYGGAERQLGTQVADSQRYEQSNLPAWYAQYQQILKDSEAATAANAAFAVGQVGALEQGLAKTSVADQEKVNAQQQASAQMRGATYDQAGANDTAQRASAARSALTSGFGAMIANKGASDRQRLIDAVPISQMQLGEKQGEERGRRKKLTDEQLEIAREKGAFGQTYMTDRRDSEHKRALERAVFNQRSVLEEQKLKQDAREKAQDTNQWGYTNAEWRKLSTQKRQGIIAAQKKAGRTPKGPGEPKYGVDAKDWQGMTPQQRREAKAAWDRAGKNGPSGGKPNKEPASSLNLRRTILDRADGFLPKYSKDNGVPLTKGTRAQVVAKLRRTHPGLFTGVNEIALSAALDRAIDGQVSRANLRKLRSRGVYITSAGEYWQGGNR